MNKILTIIGVAALLVSCQQTETIELENNVSDHQVSSNLMTIKNYISKTKRSKTRSNDITLIPYIVKGDTVMFIANYPGGGFEIFSNDNRLPMVLVKSKTGYFLPNNPLENSPLGEYVANAAQSLQKIGLDNAAEPQGMWQVYSVNGSGEDGRDPGEGGGTPVFREVGIAMEYDETTYTPSGGRLATKWDQGSYFNQCMPYFTDGSGQHALVGCGSVAVGQYLFHYNKYFGVPESTVTTATYNPDTNRYSFSGNSSTVWQQMADGSDPSIYSDSQRMMPTSVFLSYIADKLHAIYGEKVGDGTGTYPFYYASVIENLSGRHLKEKYFDYSTVIQELTNGHPVLSHSYGYEYINNQVYNVGHVYIIDYASTQSETYYRVSAYVTPNPDPDDSESEDSEANDLEYYRNKYGEIYIENVGSEQSCWISMNWGWGGYYDNVRINAQLSSWILSFSQSTIDFNQNNILY